MQYPPHADTQLLQRVETQTNMVQSSQPSSTGYAEWQENLSTKGEVQWSPVQLHKSAKNFPAVLQDRI